MSSTTSSGLPPQKPMRLSAARPRDEQDICLAAEATASERLHVVSAVVEEVNPLWFNADATASFEPVNHLPDTLMLVAVKRLNHERRVHAVPVRPSVAQRPADASEQPQDAGTLLRQRSACRASGHYAMIASVAEGVMQVQGQLRSHESASAVRAIIDAMDFLGAGGNALLTAACLLIAVNIEHAQAGSIMTAIKACMGGPTTRKAAVAMATAMQGCLEIFEVDDGTRPGYHSGCWKMPLVIPQCTSVWHFSLGNAVWHPSAQMPPSPFSFAFVWLTVVVTVVVDESVGVKVEVEVGVEVEVVSGVVLSLNWSALLRALFPLPKSSPVVLSSVLVGTGTVDS
eukprot:CAMPEP_0172854414 /NCGR_PEP_ID=MMETSP1075-20121228/57729_1 /TAXON_ID=2916 /ORGANISM="Ceratium fusus, Strain PA161109" /LENGTH=341 /DNA_ID=CAMNT_0013701057 /DNA_START=138 /DNA_END=1163 /DNA_ORIENTATION=+